MADETKNAKLLLGVETKGTDKAAKDLRSLGKGATDLQKELGKMSRAAGLDKLAREFGEVARQTDDVGSSVDELNKKLKEFGANEDEIKSVARAFEMERGRTFDTSSSGGGSGGGGSTPAAAKFRGAAGLVGGGDIVGLIDDLQDLGEGVAALSGDVTKSASAALSAGVAFGVATAAIAIIGAALKALADDQAKQADKINAIVDQQRSVGQAIVKGATTEDLTARLNELNALREEEAVRLDGLKNSYDANINSAGLLTPILKVAAGAEDALAGQIDKSTKLAQDYDAEIKAISDALQSGKLTANDAAAATATVQQAEIDLASTRTGTAVDGAREAEKAAREQARAEEKAQQEIARAAEKAQQDAEQRAEKAAAAQTKYNEAIASAGETLKQATADINTKLKQGLADNLESMFRDVTDIATKFRRDTFDADIKSNQAERDALTDHLRDIDDIREDGRKSAREAIQDGDFKALYLARQATADSLRNEQKETQRETSDRRRGDQDARADLLRNAQRERSDRMLGYERQNTDSRTAAQRELQQAQLARTRSLEAAANAYRAELAQLGQYLQARNQMQATANQQALQQVGGNRARAGNTQSSTGISGQSTIDMSGIAGFVGRMIR